MIKKKLHVFSSTSKFVTFDYLFSEYRKNSGTMLETEGEFCVAFGLL